MRLLALVVIALGPFVSSAAAQDLSPALPADVFAPAGLVGDEQPQPSFTADDTATQGPEEHPTPQHTGVGAFFRTLGADFKAFPTRPSTWVILGIGGAAALLAHPADPDLNGHIVGSNAVERFFRPGHVIGAVPTQVGVAMGLYLGGRYLVPVVDGEPRTNKWSHLGYDLLRAQIVSQAIIHTLKPSIGRARPTGECCSFPSGHAATAFAAASVIERHLGYRAAWPTLVVASYVAASRLHDNRHYLSDVLFGSAIGMTTGWTIVGRHGRNEYSLAPMPVNGGFGVGLTRRTRN
jgi:membrane-associated phospholipid phosphatase